MDLVFLVSRSSFDISGETLHCLDKFISFVLSRDFFSKVILLSYDDFLPDGLSSRVRMYSLRDFDPDNLDNEVLISIGLNYFDVNYTYLFDFHKNKNSTTTLPVKFMLDIHNRNVVEVDEKFTLKSFKFSSFSDEGYVFTNTFLTNKDVLKKIIDGAGKRDFLGRLLEGENANALPMSGEEINPFYINERKDKKKVVFIDRDGTINVDTGYVHRIEELEFVSGVIDFLKELQKYFDGFVIITNQAGVAKGKFSIDDFLKFEAYLEEQLRKAGITVIDSFYCPYHIDGIIEAYKKDSLLRKPNPGMVLLAANKHNIDIFNSIMVGDKESDRINLPYLKSYILLGNYEIKNRENIYKTYDEMLTAIIKDFKE